MIRLCGFRFGSWLYRGRTRHRGSFFPARQGGDLAVGQYLSTKYNERLAEAEIDLSKGTDSDAYDIELAECAIGLSKTEIINQIGPWKLMREVEWEALNRRTAKRNGSTGVTTAAFSPPRLQPPCKSTGGVLCKPEHARYGQVVVKQSTPRKNRGGSPRARASVSDKGGTTVVGLSNCPR